MTAEPLMTEELRAELLALGLPQSGDTDSAADVNLELPEPVFIDPETESEPGPAIDAEVTPPTLPFGERSRKDTDKAKGTAPNANEWLDFFSRIVIRFMTEFYIEFRFRGIDDSLVSEDDAKSLLMTKEERDTIARPFAEYANKNPFMKKHGREIVAFADSFESIVMLGQWFGRVERVARRYQPKKTVPGNVDRNHSHGNSGQGAESASNGYQQPGFSIFNPGSS